MVLIVLVLVVMVLVVMGGTGRGSKEVSGVGGNFTVGDFGGRHSVTDLVGSLLPS